MFVLCGATSTVCPPRAELIQDPPACSRVHGETIPKIERVNPKLQLPISTRPEILDIGSCNVPTPFVLKPFRPKGCLYDRHLQNPF